MRRWAAASLLVVAALYGRGTGQQAVAAIVAAIIVGSLVAAPRFALSPVAARFLVRVKAGSPPVKFTGMGRVFHR